MAINNPETSPISSPEPSLAAVDVSYLATTLGFPETDLRTLLTAPTAELANKFAASASTKIRAYDKLESEKRNDATECSQCFPFMRLPPELRLQVYEAVFKDTLDDVIYKGILDDFPNRGFRPRHASRNALRRHIKAAMALLHTSRTLRAEGATIAFRIAGVYAKATESALSQLRAEKKFIAAVGRAGGSLGDSVSGRYRELAPRYVDLRGTYGALRLIRDNVSESGIGESPESQVEV